MLDFETHERQSQLVKVEAVVKRPKAERSTVAGADAAKREQPTAPSLPTQGSMMAQVA